MAKQGMEVLEGGGAGRVAFWGAEHPSFLPVFPCTPTIAILVKTKRYFWLRRSCDEGKATPCWPWLQRRVGHGSSIKLAMAPRALQDLDHPWKESGHKSHLYPGKEMGTPRWGMAEISSCMYLCPILMQGYLILAWNKGSCCTLPLEHGWEK